MYENGTGREKKAKCQWNEVEDTKFLLWTSTISSDLDRMKAMFAKAVEQLDHFRKDLYTDNSSQYVCLIQSFNTFHQ